MAEPTASNFISHGLLAACTTSIFFLSNRYMRIFKFGSGLNTEPDRAWAWRDLSNSFIYTFIVSLWMIFTCTTTPDLLKDPLAFLRPLAYYLPSFSFGRFLFHLIWYVRQHGCKSYIWVKVTHHILILSGCALSYLHPHQFTGFVVLVHLNEIPLCVLCFRGLLIMAGRKSTRLFFITKCTLALFWIIFRLIMMVHVAYLAYTNLAKVISIVAKVETVCISFFLIPYNVHLFWKLVRSDFLNKSA